jgi:hypothetical protein
MVQGEYAEARERLDSAQVLTIGHSNISPLSIDTLVSKGCLDAARGLHEAARGSLSAASHANHYTAKHPERCSIFCEFADIAIKERDDRTATARLRTATITMEAAETSIQRLSRRMQDRSKTYHVIGRVIQVQQLRCSSHASELSHSRCVTRVPSRCIRHVPSSCTPRYGWKRPLALNARLSPM